MHNETEPFVKVSILVPIFNSSLFLEQCLDSVVHQTLREIEIICINDGSTDTSLQIIQAYSQKDYRIKIIDKENTGYGHSMNLGLRQARGKYIGIVESDDFAESTMFERLYELAETHQVELVKSNTFFYDEKNGDSFFEMFEECPYGQVISPLEVPKMFYGTTFVWTTLYSRDFLLRNDIWFNETPGASYQDVAFTLKTLSCAKRVYLVKDAFLHYRIDNASSSVNSKEKVYCDCDEFEELWRFLDLRPELKEKVKCFIPRGMYRIYKWNYGRIAQKFKLGFLRRVIDEFREMNNQGILRREYWDDTTWMELERLVNDSAQVIFEKFLEFQKQRIVEAGFLSEIRKSSAIYVYGAGKIGGSAVAYLKEKGVTLNKILVSNLKGNPEVLLGISVNTVETISPRSDDVILIAIREKDQYEVLDQLEALGWKRIIALDGAIREIINKSY